MRKYLLILGIVLLFAGGILIPSSAMHACSITDYVPLVNWGWPESYSPMSRTVFLGRAYYQIQWNFGWSSGHDKLFIIKDPSAEVVLNTSYEWGTVEVFLEEGNYNISTRGLSGTPSFSEPPNYNVKVSKIVRIYGIHTLLRGIDPFSGYNPTLFLGIACIVFGIIICATQLHACMYAGYFGTQMRVAKRSDLLTTGSVLAIIAVGGSFIGGILATDQWFGHSNYVYVQSTTLNHLALLSVLGFSAFMSGLCVGILALERLRFRLTVVALSMAILYSLVSLYLGWAYGTGLIAPPGGIADAFEFYGKYIGAPVFILSLLSACIHAHSHYRVEK